MAATPRNVTPPPQQQYDRNDGYETYNQPGKKTIPLHRRPLNKTTELVIRDLCWRCGGRCQITEPIPVCTHPRCRGQRFTVAEMRAHARHNWTGTLPCGHKERDYYGERTEDVPCPTCSGSTVGAGYLQSQVTFAEYAQFLLRSGGFLNGLLDILEDIYPDLATQESTEHRAPLQTGSPAPQQYQQQHQTPTVMASFQRSEPTTPAPHIPNIPVNFPAPMAPVTPVAPVTPTDLLTLTEWERQQIERATPKPQDRPKEF